ncbi:hypothetical protein NVP1144O_49 [Vibrio phage 1.144.O._10N.286.45.B3]|nr:hypothetical protein NVP1144O_49 [Vibrio phage 1.144.O._10N.286.45.B3]
MILISLFGLKIMSTKLDMVKLFLVCHPSERSAPSIAMMLECSGRTVRSAMESLNITPIKRPKECRG